MTGDPLDDDDDVPPPDVPDAVDVSTGAGGDALIILRRCFFEEEPSPRPDKLLLEDEAGRSTRTPEAKRGVSPSFPFPSPNDGGVIVVVSVVVFEAEDAKVLPELCGPSEDDFGELGLFPIASFLMQVV